MAVFVGIDLAWSARNRTGLACVDQDGCLMASTTAGSDDEIAAWLVEHDPSVVAIDAPIIVRNDSGQREAERLIGRAYGRYGASAYPSNRSNPLFDPPRALSLAQRFGWSADPAGPGCVCLEVYPHAALIGLFALPERILYKKGPDRQAGFRELAGCLQSVPELGLAGSTRWSQITAVIDDPKPGDLNRIEDEIDAIVCAHVAWLWQARPNQLTMYGSVEEGFIVAPPPPTHLTARRQPPRRPTRPGGPQSRR